MAVNGTGWGELRKKDGEKESNLKDEKNSSSSNKNVVPAAAGSTETNSDEEKELDLQNSVSSSSVDNMETQDRSPLVAPPSSNLKSVTSITIMY